MQTRSSWESQYSATSSALPQVNDEVRFIDGQVLGRVTVAGARGFKVRVNDFEIWLKSDSVFTRQGGRVTLICEADGLHRYATMPAERAVRTRSNR